MFSGCGPPPEDLHKNNLFWTCDPGYSIKNYSAYFSCALVCNVTRAVVVEYYCTENLTWHLIRQIPEECIGKYGNLSLTYLRVGKLYYSPKHGCHAIHFTHTL